MISKMCVGGVTLNTGVRVLKKKNADGTNLVNGKTCLPMFPKFSTCGMNYHRWSKSRYNRDRQEGGRRSYKSYEFFFLVGS